ncbi:MAG: hypothetical protein LAT83_11765 [Kiritimatiellae bacterium]|nr:hypothetical protein [Kiritimatiellia bacterium]
MNRQIAKILFGITIFFHTSCSLFREDVDEATSSSAAIEISSNAFTAKPSVSDLEKLVQAVYRTGDSAKLLSLIEWRLSIHEEREAWEVTTRTQMQQWKNESITATFHTLEELEYSNLGISDDLDHEHNVVGYIKIDLKMRNGESFTYWRVVQTEDGAKLLAAPWGTK